MTVLWRNRNMLLGMVGGICTKCGTPQFPRMDVCVNPECCSVHSQEDYEFSDIPAIVKSFTGDLLAVSLDPPAIYGMVQFEGGGRFMADFTDCELSEVRVGQPVKLAFRKRYTDKERGFTGYFWKAVPLPTSEAEKTAERSIRFDGKVAVVTGAGAGLGRVYALELARRGAKVVVNDLGGARDGSGAGSTAPAEKVVNEIRAMGGEAVASYHSVATPEGGQAVIDSAVTAFGRVDILINNAGILRDRTLAKMEPDEWQAVRGVHLDGAYNVTRPAFIKMREQGYGRIIVTTSAAGLYGNFGQTNYAAAKMGLVGFMTSLKLEGEKHNIKVNAVAPIAASRLTEDVLPPDLLEKVKPEYVAPLVLYLCSEECSENGMIFNAGMGSYNRAAIVSAAGIILGDRITPPTPELIHENWEGIHSLAGAKEVPSLTAALGELIERFKPQGTAEPSRKPELAVSSVFERMPAAFQPDRAAGVDVVFQYDITGPGGGTWYVSIKDGQCEVREGRHEKPTTTIIMSDEDFLSLIRRELDAMQAFTTGKLKVQGDIMKSQLIGKLFKF